MRHLSFIDCPGYANFLPMVLSGVGIMDAAILLISAHEKCGQPQTLEHLIALEIKFVQDVIVLQSKKDLIDTATALKYYDDIKKFVKDTAVESAQILQKENDYIELICKHIVENIQIFKWNLQLPAIMLIIEAFSADNSDMVVACGKVAAGILS